MSLNQLIDNILSIARNNNIGESEHLSRIQIEKWILYYRAYLILKELDEDEDEDVDESDITTISPIHLDKIETAPGKITYVGDQELPKLISSKKTSGLINVKDLYGNIIQIGDYTKAKMQKYRKATCKDYIAWMKNGKIYVEGDSNILEYISVDVIAEDPTELEDCFDPDAEFPLDAAKIPTVVQMILDKELKVMTQMPSDTSNNSQDNTLNRYSRS